MNILAADTDAKLEARATDADIQVLRDFFHPVREAYAQKYIAWLTSKASYRGATANVEGLFGDMTKKVEDWDIRIQVQYKKGTPQYLALLPGGRSPFNSGGYESRLMNLESLIDNIGADAALQTEKTEMETFLTTIGDARDTQQGKEGLEENAAAALEAERIICGEGLYYVLGGLMQKFRTTPEEVEQFFDLVTLRTQSTDTDDDEPETFTGAVAPDGTVNIVERDFSTVSQLILRNTGAVQLTFCMKDAAANACASGAILAAGEEVAIPMGSFNPGNDSFLNVTNADVSTEGAYEVILD